MTFYHFGNCLALSYIPYYLTYKYTGLSEYGAFWRCIQAGTIYTFTQLVKMLILATFFPVPLQDDMGMISDTPQLFKSSFGLEFLKSSIDMVDLVGLYFALSRIPGRGHAKILSAALGWGAAELIFTRFLTLWFGAKGVEFNWKYIQLSLDSNVVMAQHIATTTLVWLWSRHDLKTTFVPLVSAMIVVGAYKGLFIDSVTAMCGLDPWVSLIVKAAVTALLGVATLRVYSSVP